MMLEFHVKSKDDSGVFILNPNTLKMWIFSLQHNCTLQVFVLPQLCEIRFLVVIILDPIV